MFLFVREFAASVHLYSGDRHGIKPLDRVSFYLGGPPSHGAALLNAARLGLELENDVRIASERLKELKVPAVFPTYQLVKLEDPFPKSGLPETPDKESEDIIRSMPLL